MSDTVQLFVDAWKLIVERLPLATIHEEDGVVSCLGNVPLILLNLSIIVRPALTHMDLQLLLEMAARHAAASRFPCTVLLRQDWLPSGWEKVTTEAGLASMVPLTGMESENLLAPKRPLPNLEIRRVVDDQMALDLSRLNALAYHMPLDAFDCIANMRFWNSQSYGYVGYCGNQAVCCASALPVNGSVYIALVATLQEEQGKGYAEAVMRHAVAEGQQALNTTRTTLHASEMGLPVYRRMGYKAGPRMLILGPAQ